MQNDGLKAYTDREQQHEARRLRVYYVCVCLIQRWRIYYVVIYMFWTRKWALKFSCDHSQKFPLIIVMNLDIEMMENYNLRTCLQSSEAEPHQA